MNNKREICKILVEWNLKNVKGDKACYDISRIYNKEFLEEWRKKLKELKKEDET